MPSIISYKSNFTQEEYSTLQSLKGNWGIVFKTADKRDEWLAMDKNYYWHKVIRKHLLSNVYKEVSVDSDKKVFKILKEHVRNEEYILTKKEIDYLRNFKFTSSQFYCLPKVNKPEICNTEKSEYFQIHCPDDLKGRPISGGTECSTKRFWYHYVFM